MTVTNSLVVLFLINCLIYKSVGVWLDAIYMPGIIMWGCDLLKVL